MLHGSELRHVWSFQSPSLFYYKGARKDSMEEAGCEFGPKEALGFELEQKVGWKNRGHIIMVLDVH